MLVYQVRSRTKYGGQISRELWYLAKTKKFWIQLFSLLIAEKIHPAGRQSDSTWVTIRQICQPPPILSSIPLVVRTLVLFLWPFVFLWSSVHLGLLLWYYWSLFLSSFGHFVLLPSFPLHSLSPLVSFSTPTINWLSRFKIFWSPFVLFFGPLTFGIPSPWVLPLLW